MGVATVFQLPLQGASPVTVENSTATYMPLTQLAPATCATNDGAITPAIGLAGDAVLADIALDSDGKHVAVDPSRAVALTWSLVAAGPVDLTIVNVFELVNVSNAAVLIQRAAIATTGTSSVIDPSLLLSGHTYALFLETQLGQPNASLGDFGTIVYPFAQGFAWSHPFVVM
jgi:hypothetical protein